MPAPLASNAMHNRQTQPSGSAQGTSRSGGGSPAVGKNVKRKSSKPIIMWLQRKLAGTVRTRRVSDSDKGAAAAATQSSGARGQAVGRTTNLKNGTANTHGRPHANTLSAATAARDASVDENGYNMPMRGFGAYRPMTNEISLNSADGDSFNDDDDAESTRRSSGAGVSMWGSRSNPVEADEDASIRPLPPTSPPSPSPSRSSSSYLSDPRTFKSMTASTKPTTLLSIDLTNNGMAHIAQAPPTPTSVTFERNTGNPSPITRFPPHVRQPSSGPGSVGGAMAITFSALPPSPQSSRPTSLNPLRTAALQAPQHTSHHPRNNPRPSSPPRDDASVLTLASSAFGIPSGPQRWAGAADSMSHLGGGDSQSHFVLDTDGIGGDDMRDASVRALRPRSERRNSWESEASRWSAGASLVLGAGLGGLGRDRSLRTAPSFRTGGQGTLDDGASMSVMGGDEDRLSTREEGDIDEETMEDDDGDAARERAFSPVSALSFDGVPEEDGMSADAYKQAHAFGMNLRSVAADPDKDDKEDAAETDFEDVATPGPAARTIPLIEPPVLPHSESTNSGDSGATTNATDVVTGRTKESEPQTTPKKVQSIAGMNETSMKGKEKKTQSVGIAV